MKKLFTYIFTPLVILAMVAYLSAAPLTGDGIQGGSGTSFSVTDITGQTDDTTPATTATAVLAQGGSLIESTLAQIGTAITAGGNIPNTLADAAGDLIQGSADNTWAKLTKGAEGTLLRAGASSNAYTTSTFADTYAKGTFLYAATANTIASLAHPGAANYFLMTNAADTSAWTAGAALASINSLTETNGGIPYGTADNTYAWLAAGAEGTLLMGNGAGAPSFLAAGSAGQFLLGAGAADPVWTTQATLAALEALTLTQGGLLYATAADTPAILAKGTEHQILQMNTGATAPEWTSTITIGTLNLPSSDADPATTAGQIRHDSTDTDASAGGILEWNDGTNTRRVVDGAASAAANYTVIIKEEFIPVAWMTDGAAAPDAIATYGPLKYRDFAADATKDLKFIWIAPADMIGTTLKVKPVVLVTNATAPADTEGVTWGFSAASSGTSDAADPTRGTVVYSEDADLDNDCNAQYDYCVFPYVEVTPTDLAVGEVVAFTVNRKHDDTDDDYGQKIGLVGVVIKYKSRINLVDTW